MTQENKLTTDVTISENSNMYCEVDLIPEETEGEEGEYSMWHSDVALKRASLAGIELLSRQSPI